LRNVSPDSKIVLVTAVPGDAGPVMPGMAR